MLRASLLRLPVIVTFLNSAVLGMVLALLTYYYDSAPDVHPSGSHSSSHGVHQHNGSSRIASQLWHSHNVKDSDALFLTKTIRVLCFIAIDEPSFLRVALSNRGQQDTWTAIHAIIDTWGKRCSQMIVFGNVPDVKVDSIPFLAVRDDHAGGWKAFAKVLTQVSTLFDMNFDWFLKVDMNTFVIMENLRYFLSSFDPSFPFYFGHTMSGTWEVSYNSAEAGIVMSRSALLQLQKALAEDLCTKDSSSSSDIELGKCLAKISIYPQDTRDVSGHARFLPSNPKTHLLKKRSSWYSFLWTKAKYAIKEGPDCCSDYAVTFHDIHADMMTVMEFFIYHLDAFGLSNKLASPSLSPV